MHALTAKVTRNVKSFFFEGLQDCFDGVTQGDTWVTSMHMLVYSYDNDEELCTSVLSKHDIRVRNLAGEDLLQFCDCLL